MASWSPTLEGFRAVFRRPALPLAEIIWRWSFGAAAFVLVVFGFFEYLDTLPVSPLDLLFLRSRQPFMISQALARILEGRGLRFVVAGIVIAIGLAALWIMVASIGRSATLHTMLEFIRERSQEISASQQQANSGPPVNRVLKGERKSWGLRSLAGLHFLRAVLTLMTVAASVAALVLAGFVSSKDDPRPGLVLLVAFVLLCFVWLVWWSLGWLLSLASVFVVSAGEDTFGALSSAVDFSRDRIGSVLAVGVWFGLSHFALFIAATSVVAFPLSLVGVLPVAFVLTAVVILTLLYFAMVDTLSVARLAGYVAILEAPPAPPALASRVTPDVYPMSPPGAVVLGERLPTSPATEDARVDQNELILSDPDEADSAGAHSHPQDPEWKGYS
jgi:hypothetical protein